MRSKLASAKGRLSASAAANKVSSCAPEALRRARTSMPSTKSLPTTRERGCERSRAAEHAFHEIAADNRRTRLRRIERGGAGAVERESEISRAAAKIEDAGFR